MIGAAKASSTIVAKPPRANVAKRRVRVDTKTLKPGAGHLIGYARVSTADQDAATQIEKLKAAGCTVIRTEKVSGKSRDGRSELASVMEFHPAWRCPCGGQA